MNKKMKRFLLILMILFSISCVKKENDKKLTIIMIGDSITEWIVQTKDENGKFMTWEKELSKIVNANIISFAVAGWLTDNILRNINKIIQLKNTKTIAFILIGINDFLAEDRDAQKVFQNITEIYMALNYNNIKCIIQSILPIDSFRRNIYLRIKDLNNKLIQFSQKNEIDFIDTYKLFIRENGVINSDYFSDGLHLNLLGYRNWLNNGIIPYLKNCEKS